MTVIKNEDNENQNAIKKTSKKGRTIGSTGTPSSNGKIPDIIGTGDDAKNSFIWISIRWSFIIGSIISLAIYVRPNFCQINSSSIVEDLKSIWSIFIPIITLALGYAFGKGIQK